jgi:hypothetical protein
VRRFGPCAAIPGGQPEASEAEDRVLAVADRTQSPPKRRAQELPGVADADPLADAERPARPPRVYEPAPGAVLQHLPLEEVGVDVGVMDHERSPKHALNVISG